jgi:hypothetical protein
VELLTRLTEVKKGIEAEVAQLAEDCSVRRPITPEIEPTAESRKRRLAWDRARHEAPPIAGEEGAVTDVQGAHFSLL